MTPKKQNSNMPEPQINRINKKNLQTGSPVELNTPDPANREMETSGDGATLVNIDNPDDTQFEGKFKKTFS